MSIQSRVSQKILFDGWRVQNYLGGGSGGRTAVFRMERNRGFKEVCALKVINIIEEAGKWEAMSPAYQRQFEQRVQALQKIALREVKLMYQLRDNPMVVHYLDYKTVRFQDSYSFGCDLLIRMELLQVVRDMQKASCPFSEGEIIRVGKDICRALQVCHRAGIVHRDIKPANLFRNKEGVYKLGDFGVSRILEADRSASTAVGTETYAAPEQFLKGYDLRVDIYSLGLTLYELANNNCLPFSSSPFTNDMAIQRRLSGTPLPPPRHASPALSAVILKACAYNREQRYRTADELLYALEQAERAPQVVPASRRKTSQKLPLQTLNPVITQKVAAEMKAEKRQARITILGVALIIVVAILAVLLIGLNSSSSGTSSGSYTGYGGTAVRLEGDIRPVIPAAAWQAEDGETAAIRNTGDISRL